MKDEINFAVDRTLSDHNVNSGLFSGAQIFYYIKKYKIILHADENLIKMATYEMRLGNTAIRWDNEKKIVINVKKDNQLLLKPNSLTFVTTIERFNLPIDIIARFNLKSKYVHKGLLLGTGPIVDPEFQSRIVIPLHNFSSQHVCIDYKSPFISVEFTKCLDYHAEYATKLGYKYKSNKNNKIDTKEFFNKTYLVGSSVMNSLQESKKVKEETETSLNKFKTIGYSAIFASILAGLSLIFMMFQSLSTAVVNAETALTIQQEMKDEVKELTKKIKEIENKR